MNRTAFPFPAPWVALLSGPLPGQSRDTQRERRLTPGPYRPVLPSDDIMIRPFGCSMNSVFPGSLVWVRRPDEAGRSAEHRN